MQRKLITIFGLALLAPAAYAQVGVGTTSPSAKAALDITATGKGLLIPRMDSATRVGIASPPTGLMVFQTSPRVGFYYYGGAAWLFLPDKGRSGDNLGNHLATQNLVLNNNLLQLRASTDYLHGIQYNGTYDGPSIFGYNGGVLGYNTGSGFLPVLRWNNSGLLAADAAGFNTGTGPSLAFGGSGTGEGLGSARSSGNPNRYGLDFYTAFVNRLSISNTGQIGIGTTSPTSTLQVNGSVAVGVVTGLVGTSAGAPLSGAGYIGLSPGSSTGTNYYLLPNASTCPGRVIYLRNNSNSNIAYIGTGTGSDGGSIFEGGSATAAGLAYYMQPTGLTKTVTVISDGTNWTLIKGGN